MIGFECFTPAILQHLPTPAKNISSSRYLPFSIDTCIRDIRCRRLVLFPDFLGNSSSSLTRHELIDASDQEAALLLNQRGSIESALKMDLPVLLRCRNYQYFSVLRTLTSRFPETHSLKKQSLTDSFSTPASSLPTPCSQVHCPGHVSCTDYQSLYAYTHPVDHTHSLAILPRT